MLPQERCAGKLLLQQIQVLNKKAAAPFAGSLPLSCSDSAAL